MHLRPLPHLRALLPSLSVATFALVNTAAIAQTAAPTSSPPVPVAADEPIQLQKVIVTGTPMERTLFDLATPASVLTDRELAVRLQPTLGETLNTLPGVGSTSFGPNASRPVIRGLDGDHIRILENGVGLIDASATSVDHAVGTDPLTIRSVEVVRGPAALLYGPAAVGGVVNVINNRIPDARIGKAVTGAIEGRYGSVDDSRSGGAVIEGGSRGFAYHLDGFTRESGDLRIPGFARSARLRALEPLAAGETEAKDRLPNSQGKADGGAVGLSYIWDKGHVGTSVSGFNNVYGTVAEEDVTLRLHQRRVDVAGEFIAPSEKINKITYKLGLSDYRHTEYEGPAAGTVFENRGLDGRSELLHAPFGRLQGAIGFEIQRSDFSALGAEGFLPRTSSAIDSGFVFEELDLDPVRFQFGGRLDHNGVEAAADPAFGPAASRDITTGSGSAGVVYTFLEDYAAALSAAYTQRAPNYQELYADGPHVATRAYEVGDRNLGVEDSVGLDFSLRRRAGWVTGNIGVFYNRFDRFISLMPTGTTDAASGLPVYGYEGVPAEFYGAEAEAVFHLVDSEKQKLHLDLRLDRLEARDRSTGAPLPRISPMRFGGGLGYDRGPFGARIDVLHHEAQDRLGAGELPTDGYTMVDTTVTYRFAWSGVQFDLMARGVNLLDQEARNHVSFLKDIAPLGGRGATVSLRASF